MRPVLHVFVVPTVLTACVLTFGVGPVQVAAEDPSETETSSAPTHRVLVELYTSQN